MDIIKFTVIVFRENNELFALLTSSAESGIDKDKIESAVVIRLLRKRKIPIRLENIYLYSSGNFVSFRLKGLTEDGILLYKLEK